MSEDSEAGYLVIPGGSDQPSGRVRWLSGEWAKHR